MFNYNIVLMTHGDFGKEIIKSSEMIVGKSEQLYALSLEIGMSPETYVEKARNLLTTFQTPTLVLVDLYGGTPCNVSRMLANIFDIGIMTGVNLGILIEALMQRQYSDENDLKRIVTSLIETGIQSIQKVEV